MPNENDPKHGTSSSGEQGSTSQGQHRTWHEHQSGGHTGERPTGSTGEMRDDTGAQPSTMQGTSTGSSQPQQRPKQRRGFAAMDPAKQKEIASKGGKASHALGTGHEWNSETAREAGRKGGQASRGGRGKLPPGGTPEGGDSTT
jgi:general stress protein YciG